MNYNHNNEYITFIALQTNICSLKLKCKLILGCDICGEKFRKNYIPYRC
jgi:hypothetical protein